MVSAPGQVNHPVTWLTHIFVANRKWFGFLVDHELPLFGYQCSSTTPLVVSWNVNQQRLHNMNVPPPLWFSMQLFAARSLLDNHSHKAHDSLG